MLSISDFIKKYSSKINYLDLDLILAHSLGKTKEFVLTYPEQTITKKQETIIKKAIARRIKSEPIAYITGHKEFYGLDFIVDKKTLIPRPETEQIVELTLNEISNFKFLPRRQAGQISNLNIVDIGTGSGNIIISLAKNIKNKNDYIGIDISEAALKIAKKNAKAHGVDKKIKFLQGNLLTPLLKANELIKLKPKKLIVVANLPYLSKEIYSSAPNDVKKYEPKSALYSSNAGLAHYGKLLKQLKKTHATCILEISPEQKQLITKLIKNIFPSAKITFFKDLARKWRVCKIEI